MIASFIALGLIDIWQGDLRRGIAGLLLATVQALVFV